MICVALIRVVLNMMLNANSILLQLEMKSLVYGVIDMTCGLT